MTYGDPRFIKNSEITTNSTKATKEDVQDTLSLSTQIKNKDNQQSDVDQERAKRKLEALRQTSTKKKTKDKEDKENKDLQNLLKVIKE